MRKIDNIIVHCSDSAWGCAREIRKWHMDKGWADIGYHFVIGNGRPTFGHHKNNLVIPSVDGDVEFGRYLDDDGFISDVEIGAHTLGFNDHSIGVCLIGHHEFSGRQAHKLNSLLGDLMMLYSIPSQNILGHYETKNGKDQGKTCPNLDMDLVRLRLTGGGRHV